MSIQEGGTVISLQSLRQKERMFSTSRPQRKENCWNGGLVRNLILQSRWLWSGNIGCSYLFLTPLLALHYTPLPSVITRRIPLWIEVLLWLLQRTSMIHCNSLSLLFLSVSAYPSVVSLSPFHPLTLNQSCVIRQLLKSYREVFAMCVCAVCDERSLKGICMCSPVRVQSQVISSWLNIFSLRTRINKWSVTFGTCTHTHPYISIHTVDRISQVCLLRSRCIFFCF